MSNMLFEFSMITPAPLLVIAWCQKSRRPIEFSLLSLSVLLIACAPVRHWKLILLGSDYSSRLFATIEINIFLSLVLGIYLGIKRRWIAALSAVLLAWAWLLVGAVNSSF